MTNSTRTCKMNGREKKKGAIREREHAGPQCYVMILLGLVITGSFSFSDMAFLGVMSL